MHGCQPLLISHKRPDSRISAIIQSATILFVTTEGAQGHPCAKNHLYRKFIMSLIADLIKQEKNRRIVEKMFDSESSPATTLTGQIHALETVIFDGTSIDKTNSQTIIAELEAIARTL